MSNFTESQIAVVALDIIRLYPGIRTSQLIEEVRIIMNPSGEDLKILNDRNYDKFYQKVRNLKSHNTLSHLVTTTNERDCQWFPKA